MHQYLGAVGLSAVNTRKKLNNVLNNIIKEDVASGLVVCGNTPYADEKAYPAQIKHYFNSACGLSINGSYNPEKNKFVMEYYYPFLDSSVSCQQAEIGIGRRIDKAAYSALCDEPGRGIALIFQLTNSIDYINVSPQVADFYNKNVKISAMSNDGMILLPINKSKIQIDKSKAATAARNNLINLAKKGDSSAIDNLTIEDLDTYTDIYKRMKREDIFTIVDTSFMPSGFECDAYSVIGNIEQVVYTKNNLTDEGIYILTLECNDIVFDVCINENSLMGVPEEGRRFKGRIWLQGQVEFGA